MGLKLFNTLSRSLQEFAPLAPPRVGMYCCGPTVYDFAHIGNWRTFVLADLVRRTLEFKGFEVTHVMNVTDVEDKIIKGVRETRTPLREFTSRYESAFFEDMKALNCLEPHHKPRATEHLPDIISLIERLLARGFAYKAADSSVYFSIEKYRAAGRTYGKLLKINFDELRPGERVKTDEYAKEFVADFALWKARLPEDGDVAWPSPFGEGRPGWHIECSAMSGKILGQTFDLHLGGEDLIFPHHEDEIAQSEGANGKQFVKYWLHGAHLLVEGKKMSKSLGNFFTLGDLLDKGFSGREIRRLLLSAHYRETFNFTLEGLQGAKTALARIDECLAKLREIPGSAATSGPAVAEKFDTSTVQKFSDALDEDFNMSAAWAVVFEWVSELNRRLAEQSLSAADAATALRTWQRIDLVLGVGTRLEVAAPPDIAALFDARQAARKAKDFKKSDAIRDQLRSQGWAIEDTPKGPRLKKLESRREAGSTEPTGRTG
ncbi:MAG: cysteine--tRNA ligase [Limisphaerales bacterium]